MNDHQQYDEGVPLGSGIDTASPEYLSELWDRLSDPVEFDKFWRRADGRRASRD